MRTDPVPTGIWVIIWSVEESITATVLDNLVTTNKDSAINDRTSSCASEPCRSRFPCGKRVRWLCWSRLTDSAQQQNLNYAEKRQERNFLRFSAVGPTSLGTSLTAAPQLFFPRSSTAPP